MPRAGLLDVKLLWTRNGPGPELDCPHSLFAVRLPEGSAGWTVAPERAAHLLARLATDPHETGLSGDVFRDFALLVRVFQAEAGFATRESHIVAASVAAHVAVVHVWVTSSVIAEVLSRVSL